MKVRYWAGNVHKVLKTQAQCVIMVNSERCYGIPFVMSHYNLARGAACSGRASGGRGVGAEK